MNSIKFYKYHGTGNDFILVDGKGEVEIPSFDSEKIGLWCHRRFGVGADGYIVLRHSAKADFYMDYYNADGQRSTLCGNGSRCAVSLAHKLGYVTEDVVFEAVDGLHVAKIIGDKMHIEMFNKPVQQYAKSSFLVDTGSPHLVKYVDVLDEVDVFTEGRTIRKSDNFKEEGVNVNFVEVIEPQIIKVATYERGVEAETYSCGTGVTAAAVVQVLQKMAIPGAHRIQIQTKGGNLEVEVILDSRGVDKLWLIGPAALVFEGNLAY